jgi:CheY-like chemotaxis protein
MPALALTAFAQREDRIRALTAGFQMHVTKPVAPEELIVVIDTMAARG